MSIIDQIIAERRSEQLRLEMSIQARCKLTLCLHRLTNEAECFIEGSDVDIHREANREIMRSLVREARAVIAEEGRQK